MGGVQITCGSNIVQLGSENENRLAVIHFDNRTFILWCGIIDNRAIEM